MSSLLTIAGTDPSGGAGVPVDLQVFRDFGYHGLSVVTAVVCQNTVGVRGFEGMGAESIADQVVAVVDDVPPAAIKIGMIPTPEAAEVLASLLDRWPNGERPPVVLDPVMAGGGGGAALQREGTLETLRDTLIPAVDWVTPNVPEAEALLDRPVDGPPAMLEAAEALAEQSGAAVLLKGGHLRETFARGVVDVWADGGEAELLEPLDPVIDDVRGTGCQLSSALAAVLAAGFDGAEAAERARGYLNRMLHEAVDRPGRGRPVVVRRGGQGREAAREALG